MKPLPDWRDLYNTQHILSLIGSYLPTEPLIQMGCSWEPRYQHHHKVNCCVETMYGQSFFFSRTQTTQENLANICSWLQNTHKLNLEWPTLTLATGVSEKKSGFLEIIMWHLCELLEFIPLELPIGCAEEVLHKAIEARLAKYIKFTDFHFRQSKQMMFEIVHDVCGWEKNTSLNDILNLVDAFQQIDEWGIPKLLLPDEVRFMGSVSSKGFLFIFAHFLPALEGRVGPKAVEVEPDGPSFLDEAPPVPPPEPEDDGNAALVDELRLQLRSTVSNT